MRRDVNRGCAWVSYAMQRKTMELLLENYQAMLDKMSGTPLQNTRERQRIEKLRDEVYERLQESEPGI